MQHVSPETLAGVCKLVLSRSEDRTGDRWTVLECAIERLDEEFPKGWVLHLETGEQGQVLNALKDMNVRHDSQTDTLVLAD